MISKQKTITAMRDDLAALLVRIEKLRAFINSDDFEKKVPDSQDRNLMRQQLDAMERYDEILLLRYDKFAK